MASAELNIDRVLVSLKPWGKWQIRQLVVQLMLCFPAAFQLLAIIFVAPFPRFVCKSGHDNITELTGFNDSEDNVAAQLPWGQCSIVDNDTKEVTSCQNGYLYDIPREKSIVTQWDLVCDRQYLVDLSQTIFTVGQGIGTVFFMFLADRFGRKWVCLINLWITMVIGIGTAFSQSILAYTLFRLACGIFQTGFVMVVSVIILELVPVAQRTYLSLCGNCMWAIGMTTFTAVGYLCRDLQWRYIQVVLTSPCLFVIVNMMLLDESVRWLAVNGKYEEIVKIVTKAAKINGREAHHVVLACISHCENEIQTKTEMKSQQNSQIVNAEGELDNELVSFMHGGNQPTTNDPNKCSPLDLVRHPKLRLFIAVKMYTWLIHGWLYYGLLLTSSSLAGNTYLNLFLNTVTEIPGGIIGFCCLKWLGRRYTGIIFQTISALALLASSILQIVSGSAGSSAITAFSIVGKFGISISFGALFMYTPEVFPTNLRSISLGLAGAAARVGGMVAPFSTSLIRVAPWLPGLLYSGTTMVSIALFLKLPETRKRTLPQTIADVDEWFIERAKDKKNLKL